MNTSSLIVVFGLFVILIWRALFEGIRKGAVLCANSTTPDSHDNAPSIMIELGGFAHEKLVVDFIPGWYILMPLHDL